MRTIGFLVFAVGLTVASWYAARVVPPPDGDTGSMAKLNAWADAAAMPFGIGVVLMIGGGLVARRSRRSAAATPAGAGGASKSPASKDPATLLAEMATLLDGLAYDDLPAQNEALHRQLDTLLEDIVPAFLEHREALVEELGLEQFAAMISHFAGMERNAARAWSALIDDVYVEVPPSLDKAKAGLAAAREVFDNAKRAA